MAVVRKSERGSEKSSNLSCRQIQRLNETKHTQHEEAIHLGYPGLLKGEHFGKVIFRLLVECVSSRDCPLCPRARKHLNFRLKL